MSGVPVVFSTGSLHPFGLERVFGWAAETGFDGVEVMMDDRWDTHQPAYLNGLAERYGLPILALHPPIYTGAWRLGSEETLVRSARLARRISCPLVVAHPPPPGRPLARWMEGPLADARARGVIVAVENMPANPAGILRVRRRSCHLPEHLEGVGAVTLDTSHVGASPMGLMDAHAALAGQLRHARELSIIFAQHVNSYKRLVPGYEAPVYIAWSRRNRSALVRVPGFHPGQEKATRMELRCPDPSANIYLCFAALLHAGLEGIEKGYELPEPMERNLYNLSVEEREQMGIESLPADLGEAIKEAENSELLHKALGEHTYSRLLQLKREEFEDYRIQVTPYELEKFLPVL